MKKHLAIISIGLTVVCSTGCIHPSTYSVNITLDSTFDYNLLDSITLASENVSSTVDVYDEKSWTYDSNHKTTTFHWDSMPAAACTLRFQTKFTRAQTLNVDLNHDTELFMINTLAIDKVDFIDKTTFLQADTIEIFYASKGCFHDYSEKYLLIKNKNLLSYSLTGTSNDPSNEMISSLSGNIISSDIIDTLIQVELASNAQIEAVKNANIYYGSTTTQYLYILSDDKLYMFSDSRLGDWNGFDKIKKSFSHI